MFSFTFQVLDTDLVKEDECETSFFTMSNTNCKSANERFYQKCAHYDDCGDMRPRHSPQMFSCNKVEYTC